MRNIIYKNDNIILDEGLFFGRAIFETILWEDKPIFLKEHIERLKDGMSKLGLNNLEENEIENFLRTLAIRNKGVKIVVTPENIIITEREIPYKEDDYNRGFALTFSEVLKNSTSIMSYIKSTSYIENIIEKQKGIEKGYNDVIFLNEKGHITETSSANIFIIEKEVIFTPPLKDGLLSGIMRRWILENYQVYEKSISIEQISEADEVFLTNSLMGIMPVKKINDIDYSKTTRTDSIRLKYNQLRKSYGGI